MNKDNKQLNNYKQSTVANLAEDLKSNQLKFSIQIKLIN